MFRGAGWMASGAADWAGADRIRRGWSFIGILLQVLRDSSARVSPIRIEPRGSLDLEATCLRLNMSLEELESRLRARRRQTAMMARVTFALACIFLLGWMWKALSTHWTTSRVTSFLYFLPFCVLFFVLAFHNALMNYQIRTGRLATWREYLMTDERFLPD